MLRTMTMRSQRAGGRAGRRERTPEQPYPSVSWPCSTITANLHPELHDTLEKRPKKLDQTDPLRTRTGTGKGSGQSRERPWQTWRFAGPTGVPSSRLRGRSLPADSSCGRLRVTAPCGVRPLPNRCLDRCPDGTRPDRVARRAEAERGPTRPSRRTASSAPQPPRTPGGCSPQSPWGPLDGLRSPADLRADVGLDEDSGLHGTT